MKRLIHKRLEAAWSLLRGLVNGVLGVAGVRLVSRNWGPRGHYPALETLVRLGLGPDLVVDVGAASGTWTEEFLGLFPRAHFLMIDPLEGNKLALEALSERDPRIHYWRGVAGTKAGDAEFVSSGDQSSLFTGSEFTGNMVQVPMARLDTLVSEHAIAGSLLIKIDVQGAELQVLEGALAILERCAALVIELTVTPIYPDAPLATEVIAWLDDAGFVLFDICSYAQRPRDGRLSQSDMLFVRKGSSWFGEQGWS